MRKLLLILVAAVIASPATAQVVDGRALQRLRGADANSDGVVTRAEFLAYRSARFQMLDRNRDGFLSPADKPRFVSTPAGLDLASMTIAFDTNKDGRVSRVELAAGPTPAFDAADANHDGMVTRAELDAAIAAARA